MAKGPAKTSRTASALAIGLGATAVIAACHLLGLDSRTELLTLDLRFHHFSSAPANDDVVIVEIDDGSLQKVGRWPWPREVLAGVVEVLQECGARAVALDIIMPEPQKTRYLSAAGDVYDPDTAPIIGTAGPQAVFDDALFENALRTGRVLLPMHLDFDSTDLGPDEALDANVCEALRADPRAEFVSVLREAYPELKSQTRDREVERTARLYWRNRSLHFLKRFVIPPERAVGYPARPGVSAPPLVRFAALCHRSGFVAYVPEADGIMRRMPLLARTGEDLYPQFALALAEEWLAGEGSAEISADRSRITVRCPGGQSRVIPVDDQGRLMINWAPGQGRFRRESAARVASVWQLRKRMEKNQVLPRVYGLALLQRLGHTSLIADMDAVYRERMAQAAAGQRAALYDPKAVIEPPTRLLEAEREAEKRIDDFLTDVLGDLGFYVGGKPKDDPDRRAAEQLAGRYAEVVKLTRDENELLRGQIAEGLNEIQRRVKGKICMVGSTSTGAMDFVPTPVHPRMPGVLVHANIFNTIVSGAFVTEAHPAVNVAVILLAGLLVSVLGARLPILQAGPLALLMAAGYAVVNLFVVFAVLDCWLVLVSPIAAMLASFLMVTAYRQLTEEQEKRRIRNEFAHTLSPALVDQLLADPTQLDPKRQTLTCFFSDLTKFTPLAERLGEQGTVALLRRYFDRMDDVVQNRFGGFVSKYMGDGILSFFGAPVAQEDHARRALLAAAGCLREIEELNEDIAGELDERAQLSCRVGISTGPVMFGDCGSTNRPDYTAIGDCVNLASRLESANKQFGTLILVDEEAWRQGDDGSLLARPLGRIIVVGKTEPVGVWNVICPAAAASDALRGAVEDFARGVELFQRRAFAEAADAFEAVLSRLPDDGASRFHISLCRQYLAAPPPDGWDGAVQLTEK
ncbi:MAG: CHASE2 domain-containing protein [Phycisphaerae bacterium]